MIFHLCFFAVLAEIAHPDQRWLLHDVLEDISVPTLTLWGDSDKVRKLSNSKPIYTSKNIGIARHMFGTVHAIFGHDTLGTCSIMGWVGYSKQAYKWTRE